MTLLVVVIPTNPQLIYPNSIIGTIFAVARLNLKKIYCIQPSRVNVGGQISVMVFDKTGTLTEDGLHVHGMILSNNETSNSSNSRLGYNTEVANKNSHHSHNPGDFNFNSTIKKSFPPPPVSCTTFLPFILTNMER